MTDSRRVREALAVFVNEGNIRDPVRPEIGASWDRSVRFGLRPDRFDVRYDEHIDTETLLVRAARPILEEVAGDLSEVKVGVVLTNDQGHVVGRWVADRQLTATFDRILLAPGFLYGERLIGTNAIGTALAQRRPSIVNGTEHFADALVSMACVAIPISDPFTGRPLGVVDVTYRAGAAYQLMVPLMRAAVREIERRLVDDTGATERMILQRFLRERRGAKGPFAVVNDRRVIANAAAEGLIDQQDQPVVWEQATRLVAAGATGAEEVDLSGGRVSMRAEPLFDGGRLLGVLVHLNPKATDTPTPGVGVSSLTSTERRVAVLVAEGLTNRQIAERLFISRYTVDSHLRSIFQKTDVHSRVELARSLLGNGLA